VVLNLGCGMSSCGAGLTVMVLFGRVLLRRVFEIVAESKSNEAFVAMCLMTVTGASVITTQLGLSSTLGAFMAGVLLAETNFRNQVRAPIRDLVSVAHSDT